MIPRDDVNEADIRDIMAWLKDKTVKSGIVATISTPLDRHKKYKGDAEKGKMTRAVGLRINP